MYTMKDVCQITNMPYETLKFYCNQGLIPNHHRDKNNHRVFDEHNLAWIQSLTCLKKCKMSIAEMKAYLALCLEGASTIPQRQRILAEKQQNLRAEIQMIQEGIDYIDWKQGFYQDVLNGKTPYTSNLVPVKDDL